MQNGKTEAEGVLPNHTKAKPSLVQNEIKDRSSYASLELL